jgi:hypothetical protein
MDLLKNEYFPSPSFRYIFESPKLISWLVKTGIFGVYKDALSKAGLYRCGEKKSLDFEILVSLDDRGIDEVEIWNDCVAKHLDKLLAWGFIFLISAPPSSNTLATGTFLS